ncbi:MAG TPA: addiction module killer protein [Desulfonatronum sp.]|nr:addiction module killer protein [Desulfonatronum sp.]
MDQFRRLYYIREGDLVYLLLCGGDKSSQERDIKKAKELAHKRRGAFQ